MAVDKDKPRVVSVLTLDGRDESALFALTASLAAGLDAQLGTAILESARERDIHIRDVDAFHATGRAGVAGSVAGHTVVLGNTALFVDLGLSVESLGDWPERLRQRGQQVVFVAVDGRTAGIFGVVDAGE